MFNASQRQKVLDAINAEALKAKGVAGRKVRGIMSDEHKANAVVDVMYRRAARQNPKAGDGELLKIVLEWIKDGGLTAIAQFIAAVAAIFIRL